MYELKTSERVVLAIDSSSEKEAEILATVAQEAGARFIKMGTELSSASSWAYCSELAESHNLEWIADAKLHDAPNTVANTVQNIRGQNHPPFGITMHTTSGFEAMTKAKEQAKTTKMIGVTVLSSIGVEEAEELYLMSLQHNVLGLAYNALRAGFEGVVCSPKEVEMIKSHSMTKELFTLVPGIRSEGVSLDDQARVGTPAQAIKDGADLLVIGRQITQAKYPIEAFQSVISEIEEPTQ